MRRFLLCNLLIFIAGSLISQNLNVAEHESVDQTGEMVSINSKMFYLKTSLSGCCTSSMTLVGIKDSGKVVFKTSFGNEPLTHFGRLIKTKDNALFLNGASTHWCDLGRVMIL